MVHPSPRKRRVDPFAKERAIARAGVKSGNSKRGEIDGEFSAAILKALKGELEPLLKSIKGEPGHTPVYGKDYLTKAEIEKIKADIAAMVPKPEDGKDAVVDYKLVYAYAKQIVDGLPKPKDGEPGKDAVVDYEVIISNTVKRVMANIKLPTAPNTPPVDYKEIRDEIERQVRSRIGEIQAARPVTGSTNSIRNLVDVILTGVPQDAQGRYVLTPGGGASVPPGGTVGQVLKKQSSTDGDADWEDETGGAGLSDGDYGDVNVSGGATAITIKNDVVTNAKLANMATKTYKGRTSAGSGDPEDVPVATLKADLALAKGDVGLGNVDNTADSAKPVSTAHQAALDLKENLSNKSTNTSLGTSNTLYPTQNAVKAYTDNAVSAAVVGLLDDRGNYDASSNLFPSTGGSGSAGAILKGDLWTVSVAGTLGGAAVTVGDVVRALVDIPGQTSTNWAVTENNNGYVAENSANKSTSTSLGTSNTLYPSQNAVKVYADAIQAFVIQRVNHTGTQLASTISDFAATVRSTVLTGLSVGTAQIIAAGDTVLQALGYLQAQITVLKTKLDFITITQAVNLDTLESDTATNNAKVTNATHTGDVAGSGALTAQPAMISGKASKSTLAGTEEVLINDAGTLKKTTAQDIADLGGGVGGGSNTFNDIYIDQAGGTSDTYGALAGARNGSNTVFTVSQGQYATGTLKVWRNGQLLTQGTSEDFVETTPASGTFTLAVAPSATDEITAEYQLVVTNSATVGDVKGPASATDEAIARYDTTTGKLLQNSPVRVTDNGSIIQPENSSPTPASAGEMKLFAREISSRILPAFVGPNGLDSTLQPLLARNKVGYWCPPGNATTVPGVFGIAAFTTTNFTATARNVATTNLFTRMRRLGYVTAATAAAIGHFRQPANQISLGDGSGLGGFTYIIRFGTSDAATVAGARMFMGVRPTTSPSNVEPSTLTNCIGVGHGASDTNLKLFYGGSSAQTPIDLGANFPANSLSVDVYELALFSSPNTANEINWTVTRLNTGNTASGTLSGGATVLPQSTTLIAPWGYRTNNATALAVGLDVMSVYLETDL